MKEIPIYPTTSILTSIKIARDHIGFMEEVQKSYPDIARLKIGKYNYIYLYDPKMISDLFKDPELFGKSSASNSALFGKSIMVSDGPIWKKNRIAISRPFGTGKLRENYLDFVSDLCKKSMGNQVSGEIRLDRFASEVTVKTIWHILFETELGDKEAKRIMGIVDDIVRYLHIVYSIPFSLPNFMPFRFFRTLNGLVRDLDDLVYRALESSRDSKFLNHLLEVNEWKSLEGKKQIRDEIVTLLFAGYETTTFLISYTAALIFSEPQVLDRIRLEIGQNRDPDLSSESSIPTLDAAMKETLRLFPIVWAVHRYTSKEGQFHGYQIPKDHFVLFSPWILQRDSRFFDDPLSWKPSRWMDSGDYKKEIFIPFGGGGHLCVGNHLSLMESRSFLYWFIKSFEFNPLVDPRNVPVFASTTIRPKKPLSGRLAQR